MNPKQNQYNGLSTIGQAQQAVRETQVQQQFSRICDANERVAKATEQLFARLQDVTVDHDHDVKEATKPSVPEPMIVRHADKLRAQADAMNANAQRLEDLASAIEL